MKRGGGGLLREGALYLETEIPKFAKTKIEATLDCHQRRATNIERQRPRRKPFISTWLA